VARFTNVFEVTVTNEHQHSSTWSDIRLPLSEWSGKLSPIDAFQDL
jgi:hypothetical protein